MARDDDTTTTLDERSDRSSSGRTDSSRNGTTRERDNRDTTAADEGYTTRNGSNRDRDRETRTRAAATHEHRTAKIVELVCSSSRSFEAAIENGLEDARETTRGITGADIVHMSIQCQDGKPVAYKVNLKLSFGVER